MRKRKKLLTQSNTAQLNCTQFCGALWKSARMLVITGTERDSTDVYESAMQPVVALNTQTISTIYSYYYYCTFL